MHENATRDPLLPTPTGSVCVELPQISSPIFHLNLLRTVCSMLFLWLDQATSFHFKDAKSDVVQARYTQDSLRAMMLSSKPRNYPSVNVCALWGLKNSLWCYSIIAISVSPGSTATDRNHLCPRVPSSVIHHSPPWFPQFYRLGSRIAANGSMIGSGFGPSPNDSASSWRETLDVAIS
jgi:hypothetical protein